MRSHSSSHSHHSSSHRSSMSSHRSSLGRHHSSLASRRHSSLHSNIGRKHGISNAHAFAVGKSTGVNINGSAMGAHGAALHHSRQIRDRQMHSSNAHHRTIRNTIRRTTGGSRVNNHSSISGNRFKSSTSSHRRYTLNLNKYGNNPGNQVGDYAWTGVLILILMLAMSFLPLIMFFIMIRSFF